MSLQEDVRDRQERGAKNQSLFREVNERIKDVNDGFHALTLVTDWVCECANDTCVERVEMSGQEYERIRADGTRFLVAASEEHVWPDVERVVAKRDGYWVVEKIELAANVSKQQDPRADGPLTSRT